MKIKQISLLHFEETNEAFVSHFDREPKKDAEKLENIYYRGAY